MKSLDDDVKEAISKMKEFMKMAQKKNNFLPERIIAEEGIKIPNVSNFQMKPCYDEYGKNVIYYYNKNSNFIMILGNYSHQEIMNSSFNYLKKRHLNYLGIKKYNFFYIVGQPNQGRGPKLKITTDYDGWSGDIKNHLYIYQLKPDVLFINWKKNPFDQK